MSYKKPIIVEIYTRIFLNNGQLSNSRILDFACSLKEIGYTNNDIVLASEPSTGTNEFTSRIRCWDQEKIKLIQLSKDTIIFNYVKEYPGWTAFKEFVKEGLDALDKNINTNFQSVDIRTIDTFEIPDDSYRFGDWINCKSDKIPAWYNDSTDTIDITMGKGSIKSDCQNRQLLLSARKEGGKVRFKIEAAFHDRKHHDDLFSMMDTFHQESNHTFESIITDRVRIEIMEGKQK